MTEQFSKEYVDFVQGEGIALQKYADWAAGHWCWHNEHGLCLVFGTDLPISSATDVISVTENGLIHYLQFDAATLGRPDVWWLPTLWQLIQIIEGAGWPVIELTISPDGDEVWPKMHMEAAARCVDWNPEGGGFWRCEECGDSLHEQDDGSVTCGPWPEEVSDEAYEEWDGGAKLPVCPHCGHAADDDLLLAAARLAVRAVEGKE